MRPFLVLAALLTALLSGCAVEESDPTADGTQAEPEGAAPPVEEQEEPVADEAPACTGPHGEPQVTETAVESGPDVDSFPGAWARKGVTITNDFGGATLGVLATGIAAGSIVVQSAQRDGYLVEAVLEARAATEADARDVVERSRLDHDDVLDGTTLRLSTFPATDDPVVTPLPVNLGFSQGSLSVQLVITVPVGPAIDLTADSASGDLGVQDLTGPRVDLATASGDVLLDLLAVDEVLVDTASGDVLADGVTSALFEASTSSGDILASGLEVRKVEASSSSGDIGLAGTIDDLAADTSSGDVMAEASPSASGSYDLGSASGDVTLVLANDGQAYHVEAGTASGDIEVDVPDGQVIEEDERRVEVASAGYDDASLQTAIDIATSSGDITVRAE